MMQIATLGERCVVSIRRFIICTVCLSSSGSKTLAFYAVLFGGCLQVTGIVVRPGQQAATINKVTVNDDHQDLGVEITATAPITPSIQTLTDPDRLIVDIPEAVPSSGLHKISVNRGKLRDIRIGLLSANPPITRVVLDLTAATSQYRVSPLANTIVVELGNESGPGPAPIRPTTTQPVGARPAETTYAVATPPPVQPTAPSRARWILPILVMATVVAMLVIAIVANIQNRRDRRGL
jgi:hypothetical protein